MRGALRQRRLLVAGAALIIIGGIGLVLLLAAFNRFTVEGSVRPPLNFRTVEGSPVRLAAPYTRRHLLLFFLVSCSHCREELEHLRRLRPAISSCDVFGVSLSHPAATSQFALEHAFPFPIWTLPANEALVQLGVRKVPTLLFVNEMDHVNRVRTGARSFLEDSLVLLRYCQGDALGFSAVDSLGEDGSPTDFRGTSGRAGIR